MILTLGDIISRATTLAGGRRDWDTSEVSFWGNVAAAEVFGQVWATGLEALAISSTTSGENRITLPTDFDGPISLSNISTQGVHGGRGLDMKAGDWIDSQWTTDLGEPETYALFATWMELWPTPDSAYSLQLRYWAKQPTLTASTATPSFDERWHPGWLYKTTELLQASRDNPEGEAMARNRYIGYMTSIKDDRTMRQQAKEGMSLAYKTEQS